MHRRKVVIAAAAMMAAQQLAAQPAEKRIEEALKQVDAVAAKGPFQPSWPSLEGYKVAQWYEDAKFGIFIHWGVYAVPAFSSEWYPRNMYVQNSPVFKHHVEKYGPQLKFGYKDFIPLFKAEKYNPDAWA